MVEQYKQRWVGYNLILFFYIFYSVTTFDRSFIESWSPVLYLVNEQAVMFVFCRMAPW